MCGRYTLHRDPRAIVERLRARFAADVAFAERYNIAPTTRGLSIVNTSEREVRDLSFGIVPRFAERNRTRLSTFNARIETLATSPLYGPLLPIRRCIVLADGYYEWPANPGGDVTPVYISRKDARTIAFAGLWDGDSMTVITQPPNDTIGAIHDRMPVSLDDELADAWLSAETLAPARALAILQPSASDLWSHHFVERAVGNTKNDGPELILERAPKPSAQLPLF